MRTPCAGRGSCSASLSSSVAAVACLYRRLSPPLPSATCSCCATLPLGAPALLPPSFVRGPSRAMASMQFCRSCNNLLYPREDKVAKKLMFACGRCRYEQEAENPVVFRHEVVKSVRCAHSGARGARRDAARAVWCCESGVVLFAAWCARRGAA